MTTMNLDARIAALVVSNRGQMRHEEYAAVAESILSDRPMAMLVFGVGRDSQLWIDLKPPGSSILFVEDNLEWAKWVGAPVMLTRYHGTVANHTEMDPMTTMDAWPLLSCIPWDWILVDGPRGDQPHSPGRLGPLAFVSGYDARVLVHDIHRPTEATLCGRYLAGREQRTVHHLRIFGRP